MNYNKKDKNWIYHLIIAVLVVILIVVSFCMLSIHVPYFNHENDIALERNKIINKHKLNYDDYFNEKRCIEYITECAETYEDREMLRLYLSDISKSEIARKLGLSRDYVRYRID